MQRVCWFNRKHKRKLVARFGAVKTVRFLAEYRGVLAQTPYAIHHFTCTRLSRNQSFALAIGAIIPTHMLYCVCYLFRAPTQARLVFNAPIMVINDGIAVTIANDLFKGILRADRVFLVRCSNRREFPWCVGQDHFNEFWAIEIRTWVRLRSKK